MLKVVFCSVIFLISALMLSAQTLNVDPAMTSAVIVSGVNENVNLNDIKAKQNAIITAQTATMGLINKINGYQQKTLDGLRYVSTTVKNTYQIARAYKVLMSIYDYQSKMLSECVKDPLASLLAYKVEKEMVEKAIKSYSQIATLILNENDNFLMDSGDRTKLLFNILTDLEVIEGFSYAAYYTVHVAVMNGVLKTLNPFNHIINNDANIVKNIMSTWKF